MFNKIYWAFGAVIIGLYVLANVRGWEFSNPVRQAASSSVRRGPTGPHGTSFWWFSGFGGGK